MGGMHSLAANRRRPKRTVGDFAWPIRVLSMVDVADAANAIDDVESETIGPVIPRP